MKIVPFADPPTADLIVDAVYEGGSIGNTSDDALSKVLGVGDMGGFRMVGPNQDKKLIALNQRRRQRLA